MFSKYSHSDVCEGVDMPSIPTLLSFTDRECFYIISNQKSTFLGANLLAAEPLLLSMARHEALPQWKAPLFFSYI
jgi:hypothetical protein